MVYFLRNSSNKTVKIGYSINPSERIRALQTGNSASLVYEYVIENVEPSFEHFVHEVCARYRVAGEWFAEDVIEKHLLKHPWYFENMKPYRQWLKEQKNAVCAFPTPSEVLSSLFPEPS